jgi:hypothetical protein
MVGFTFITLALYYYLRRRSPAPPFPPDHRQAGVPGERGGIPLINKAHYGRGIPAPGPRQGPSPEESQPGIPSNIQLI